MRISIFFIFIFSSTLLAKGVHPSVLLFHGHDLDRCSRILKNALSLKPKKIKLVLTSHFEAEGNRIKRLCFKKYGCHDFNPTIISRLKRKLKRCLSPLQNQDLEVLYTPHLDDLNNHSLWRNYAVIDPLENHGSSSYFDIMLNPILEIKEELNLNLVLSLQGEMGASVFKYPASYLSIHMLAKSLNVKTVLGFNFNQVNGFVYPYNVQLVSKLLHQVDRIGFSAYAPIKEGLGPYFSSLVYEFNSKLTNLGISEISQEKIFLAEVGLGGGSSSNDNRSVAQSLEELQKHPFSGVQEGSPWSNVLFQSFRYFYHKALIQFAQQEKRDAFLWNSDSWDPLGIYPSSQKFKDEAIIRMIMAQ